MEPLQNESVLLEQARDENVGLLIQWSLDPIAQGPYKKVPLSSPEELRILFLDEPKRQYFLISTLPGRVPLGRFYWRAWEFEARSGLIDWELNIFIALPELRGHGFGTMVQKLASDHLLTLRETQSVFAYTDFKNFAEQRSLEKAGFIRIGTFPHTYYQVPQTSNGSYLIFSRVSG